MREFHARCVKISRKTVGLEIFFIRFTGFYAGRPVGIASAKVFSRIVLTGFVI